MMLSSFKPQVAPARLNVARASPRVFTDSEWAAATKTATQMLAASESEGEAAVASETGSGVSAVPAPAGRTFSDQDWEKAMKSAPQLLKTLQSIEEGAAAGEAVTRESATSAASSGDFVGKTFTPQQWDAAIKVAVAANQAEEEKAKIDDTLNAMKTEASDLAPPSQSPSMSDVMAFSGPAPELINGRAAMLAFVAAAAAELSTGSSVASQFESATVPVVLAVALVTVASLIPLFSAKEGNEPKAAGPFTSDAETTNGRAAMIGITAVIVLEAVRQMPLF